MKEINNGSETQEEKNQIKVIFYFEKDGVKMQVVEGVVELDKKYQISKDLIDKIVENGTFDHVFNSWKEMEVEYELKYDFYVN